MTKFRAPFSALATGIVLLCLGPIAVAVENIISITGEQSPVDGACVAAIPATGGFDCSYDMTDPIGAGTAWSGPIVGSGYYAVGDSPFANGDTTSDSAIGDDKIRVQLYTTDPYASNITIDNGANDPPNCDTSDRIGGLLSLSAATRWFQGGPGQKGEETWGDGMVRIQIDPKVVDKAAANADGGCDYEVASIIMPKRLDIDGGVAPDDKYPADVLVEPGTYVAPSDDPIFCGTDGGGYLGSGGTGSEGNCGAVVMSVLIGPTNDVDDAGLTDWNCQDNTNAEPKVCSLGSQPTDGACDGDGSHYCGTRNDFENVLISISTDSNGDITDGLIFMHNETRIFEVGPPSPDFNSWDGAVYTFTGTCTNCSLVRNDSYTLLDTDSFPVLDLDIGANDSPDLGNPATATITMAATNGAASITNDGGDPLAITAVYDPTQPFTTPVTDSFQYTVDDNGTSQPIQGLVGTVNITIEEDIAPTSPDGGPFPAVMDPEDARGIDPTSLTITTDIVADLAALGNTAVVNSATDGAQGTTAFDPMSTLITYTPAATFFAGADRYTYTTADNGIVGPNPSTSAGTVAVTIPNVDPAATDVSVMSFTTIPVEFTLGNGSLANHTLSATSDAFGTCSISSAMATGAEGTAVVTYVAQDGPLRLEYTCTYTVTDGDGANPAQGTITINPSGAAIQDYLPGGGNAMDPWSLSLLLGLPFLRRGATRRRRHSIKKMGAALTAAALLFAGTAQAAEWVILPTVQNGNPNTDPDLDELPTLGMVLWFTVGTNGGGTQLIYGQGTGPGYACYGLAVGAQERCADPVAKPEIWAPGAVMYSGTVSDSPPLMTLSWTGQAGSQVGFNKDNGLFTSTVLSGTYDAAGDISDGVDPGDGYDADGFSCWNNPTAPLPGPPDFCGNGTGLTTTIPPTGQTKANRELPLGLVLVTDHGDGTITIDMGDSTYSDCVDDAACTPGSNSSDVFASWTVNAEFAGITVSNYVGLTVDDATQEIIDAGLTVGKTTRRYSETVVPGQVMFQNPAEGSRAERGDAVDLIVASNIVVKFPGGSAIDPWSLSLLLGLPLLRRPVRRTQSS